MFDKALSVLLGKASCYSAPTQAPVLIRMRPVQCMCNLVFVDHDVLGFADHDVLVFVGVFVVLECEAIGVATMGVRTTNTVIFGIAKCI